MSNKKELNELLRKAEHQGWRIDDRGKSWMIYSPDGQTIVTIHKTPSDWRAFRNTVARMKRGGFDPDA